MKNCRKSARDDRASVSVLPTSNPQRRLGARRIGMLAWFCGVLATSAVPAWPQPPAAPQPSTPALADHGEQMPELELFIGESRVLPAPGVARIAVGSGQVITASALDGKDVIVFANGAGTTTLLVWNRDGAYQRIKVNVLADDMSRHARGVAAFLSAIPNAKVTVVGDKVVVEGEYLSDPDRDKIAELARRYPLIVNFTGLIGSEQTVMMDVKVVEFPRTQLRELGLRWSAAGGAASGGIWSPANRGSSPTIPRAGNLGLNAQLKILEQNGNVAMLAEPQLSTRSGDKTTFHAGGEIPYSVATANGATVQFKPYGIKLDIEPRVGRSGVIRAVIDSEVSMVDPSVATASGPGLLIRRTRTEFNVKPGETIVLSGLLQRNKSTDIESVPLLGDIPILGALFRSKRFQSKETELVVFVTPHLGDSQGTAQADPVAAPRQRLEQNLGAQAYLGDPPQAGTQPAQESAGGGRRSGRGSCQLAAALPCPR